MNKNEQEKVGRFLQDEVLANAIHTMLLEAFLKPQEHTDVNVLAASRISIDMLGEAWKELEKNRIKVEQEDEESSNIGL